MTERDICTKFITPALEKAGWDTITQFLEEYPLTKGRVIVRGKLHTRAKNKRAEYGTYLIKNLAKELEPEFGSGFSVRIL
jgi:type I restriction enzyme, R subunit